jgi:hypothetical protein
MDRNSGDTPHFVWFLTGWSSAEVFWAAAFLVGFLLISIGVGVELAIGFLAGLFCWSAYRPVGPQAGRRYSEFKGVLGGPDDMEPFLARTTLERVFDPFGWFYGTDEPPRCRVWLRGGDVVDAGSPTMWGRFASRWTRAPVIRNTYSGDSRRSLHVQGGDVERRTPHCAGPEQRRLAKLQAKA